jgi:hypothetical protein
LKSSSSRCLSRQSTRSSKTSSRAVSEKQCSAVLGDEPHDKGGRLLIPARESLMHSWCIALWSLAEISMSIHLQARAHVFDTSSYTPRQDIATLDAWNLFGDCRSMPPRLAASAHFTSQSLVRRKRVLTHCATRRQACSVGTVWMSGKSSGGGAETQPVARSKS